MKKKIIKIIAILLIFLLLSGIITVSVITYAYYNSPIVQNSKISYTSYLINCFCIILFIKPSEAAYSLSSVYKQHSDNYWEGYNDTSLFWLKYSAFLGGISVSQEELSGYYYFKKKDVKSAIYWMEKAVNHLESMQFTDCKAKLALLYCEEGEYKNLEKALKLYKESADKGNKESEKMYLLLLKKLHPMEYNEIQKNEAK